jgi:hypothetical protein
MGMIKGQKEYEKFKAGAKLSRKQAMLAHCYECNGFEKSNEDCQGKNCPGYQFMPYKGKKKDKEATKGEGNAEAEIVASGS